MDSGYRGEVMAKFKPVSKPRRDLDQQHKEVVNIYNVGDRICQLIIIPYPSIQLVESDELSDTERGEGGFGSSGNNMVTYLLGKSSTGKFRFVIATLGEEWDNGFHITREYGQVGGKVTTAPDLCITKGLSTRTPKEQALLKYNHIIKEYTDKAYK